MDVAGSGAACPGELGGVLQGRGSGGPDLRLRCGLRPVGSGGSGGAGGDGIGCGHGGSLLGPLGRGQAGLALYLTSCLGGWLGCALSRDDAVAAGPHCSGCRGGRGRCARGRVWLRRLRLLRTRGHRDRAGCHRRGLR